MKKCREQPMHFMKKWKKRCKDFVSNGYPHRHTFKKLCRQMIQEFDQIETLDVKKPRVGIVGEILVKFLPAANNHLVELLEKKAPKQSFRIFWTFYSTASTTRISRYPTLA